MIAPLLPTQADRRDMIQAAAETCGARVLGFASLPSRAWPEFDGRVFAWLEYGAACDLMDALNARHKGDGLRAMAYTGGVPAAIRELSAKGSPYGVCLVTTEERRDIVRREKGGRA